MVRLPWGGVWILVQVVDWGPVLTRPAVYVKGPEPFRGFCRPEADRELWGVCPGKSAMILGNGSLDVPFQQLINVLVVSTKTIATKRGKKNKKGKWLGIEILEHGTPQKVNRLVGASPF